MNALEKFFKECLNDQLRTAGDNISLINPKTQETKSFNAVVTQTSGDVSLEIGDINYAISAHVLIPQDYVPKVGYVINHRGEKYKIIKMIKSPWEAAYSCDLIKI